MDRLAKAWGIETYEGSEAFGELVCPIIYMWGEPGGLKTEMTGAVKHNSLVGIQETREIDGRVWHYVGCDIWHDGQLYPQRGWLLGDMLVAV